MATCLRRPVFLALFTCAPLLLAGCEEDADDDSRACEAEHLDWGRGGEYMLPGTDCIDCHRPRASASDSAFAVAGTVFTSETCPTPVEGAVIHVTDGKDRTEELVSNEVGNFFSTRRLEPPFLFAVEYGGEIEEMEHAVDSGSCNRCHADGSRLGFVPVEDD